MQSAGYEHYETSAYALAGRRSRHNLNYWTFGDYLGIGAGAHGKISNGERGVIVRTQQTREPRRYLAADPDALARKPINAAHLPFDFAMNGFRLVEVFSDQTFESRTGLPASVLDEALASALSRGLVARDVGTWRATPRGFRFLNDILVPLLN